MTEHPQQQSTSNVRLVLSWTLVVVPLGYGLYETLVKVAELFTG